MSARYIDGDVVWVKLGSCWWPGEVKDAESLPTEVVDFKKTPLAIVKFFDEDSYEYIKSENVIFPYNCEKKNDFIKKGMASFRSKVPHMEKFPKDVSTAEIKTGGNPNILSEPIFRIDKRKKDYVAEIFGSPSPRKAGKDSAKKRASLSTKSPKQSRSHITHRRFLGYDDYKVHICIQYPGKDRPEDSEDTEEIKQLNQDPQQTYNCPTCNFSTKRLEVMILHTKAHIQGWYKTPPPTKKSKKAPRKLKKTPRIKTSSSNSLDDWDSSSDDEEIAMPVKKSKATSTPKKNKQKAKLEEPKAPTDIRNDLLAEWDDDDSDDDDTESHENASKNNSDPIEVSTDNANSGEIQLEAAEEQPKIVEGQPRVAEERPEVAEETPELAEEQPKIPEGQPKVAEEQPEVAEERPEVAEEQPVTAVEQPIAAEDTTSGVEGTFVKEAEETSVNAEEIPVKEPEVAKVNDGSTSVKEAIKSCFDFEEEEEDTAIIATAVGRKIPRVIPPTEKRKSDDLDDQLYPIIREEIENETTPLNEEDRPNKGILDDTENFKEPDDLELTFKELMESASVPELPDINIPLKCEQNFHNARTIKFPDKQVDVDPVTSPPKIVTLIEPVSKETSEVATKLTNPKKRFVKSFEDFEMMQNQQRLLAQEEKHDLLSVLEEDRQEPVAKNDNKKVENETTVVDVSFECQDKNIPSVSQELITTDVMEADGVVKDNEVTVMDVGLNKLSSETLAPDITNVTQEGSSDVIEENKVLLSPMTSESLGTAPKNEPVSTVQDVMEKRSTDVPDSDQELITEPLSVDVTNVDKDYPVFIGGDKKTESGHLTTDIVTESAPKLKNQLMSKFAEETSSQVPLPIKRRRLSSSHRSPRSKILESYRNESKRKSNEIAEVESSPQKDCTVDDFKEKVEDNNHVEKSTINEPSVFPSHGDNTYFQQEFELHKRDRFPPKKSLRRRSSSLRKSFGDKYDAPPPTEETLKVSQNVESHSESAFSEVVESAKEEETLNVSRSVESHSEGAVREVVDSVAKEEDISKDSRNVESHSESAVSEVVQSTAKENDDEVQYGKSDLMEGSVLLNNHFSGSKDELVIGSGDLSSHKSKEDVNKISTDVTQSENIASYLENESANLPEPLPPVGLPENNDMTSELSSMDNHVPTDYPKDDVICDSPEENKVHDETGKLCSVEELNIITEKQETETSLSFTQSDVPGEVEYKDYITEDKKISQLKNLESTDGQMEPTESLPKEILNDSNAVQCDSNTVQSNLVHEQTTTLQETSEQPMFPTEDSNLFASSDTVQSNLVDEQATLQETSKQPVFISEGSNLIASNNRVESNLVDEQTTALQETAEQPIFATEDSNLIASNDAIQSNLVDGQTMTLQETSQQAIFTSDESTLIASSDYSSVKSPKTLNITREPDEKLVISDRPADASFANTSVDYFFSTEPITQQPVEISDSNTGSSEEIATNKKESLNFDSDDSSDPFETANKPSTERLEGSINEVSFDCAAGSELDDFKISIKTNLTNFTKAEEMSALTLAGLSELKSDQDSKSNSDDVQVHSDSTEDSENLILSVPVSLKEKKTISEPEMVTVDANPTVVSEKDLADCQVEITSDAKTKPVTLTNFSIDFSESTSDSNSLNDVSESDTARSDSDLPTNVKDIEIKRSKKKVINKYERLELLDILEGKSSAEPQPKELSYPKKDIMDEMCDFEDHIPSQIVRTRVCKDDDVSCKSHHLSNHGVKEISEPEAVPSKLLERLTENKNKEATSKPLSPKAPVDEPKTVTPDIVKKPPPRTFRSARGTKYIVKTAKKAPVDKDKSKPVVGSEKNLKPVAEKVNKRSLTDEDVEQFIIKKSVKRVARDPDSEKKEDKVVPTTKTGGKAKILQQTIITPAGEILQPTVTPTTAASDVFDINSMPIVLSDEILTPESIENMPIVLGNDAVQPSTSATSTKEKPPLPTVKKTSSQNKILNKSMATPGLIQSPIIKPVQSPKFSKTPRILQTVGNRLIKQHSPLLTNTGKPGKYIIVPQTTNLSGNKLLTKKQPAVVKRAVNVPASSIATKVQNIAPEPSGNKIMIVTNQQGQQQRLLLTPAQQKLLGYQTQDSKITKTVVKGNFIQKSVLAPKTTTLIEAGPSAILKNASAQIYTAKPTAGVISSQTLTSSGQVIGTLPQHSRTIKGLGKRLSLPTQRVYNNPAKSPAPRKTILIKNQHGQTVRKIQGTDDALLDKQVAEQLEAIKASSSIKMQQKAETINFKPLPKPSPAPKAAARRSYSKKQALVDVPKTQASTPVTTSAVPTKTEASVPPLAPFMSTKKSEASEIKPEVTTTATSEIKTRPDRPLNQLVIQDALGNQTTITEGQILALPSETVDGQPQSYMLVTLDESGNLTPLNSEALMSLDPNLGLGGDLSNMVLQIDQGALSSGPSETVPLAQTAIVKSSIPVSKTADLTKPSETAPVEHVSHLPPDPIVHEEVIESKRLEGPQVAPEPTVVPHIPNTVSTEAGQQLIVTGDPIATQKFLESLSEGTSDLANILANTEGSILIQADGQQILINTNSDNQMLLSVNSDNLSVAENTEAGGNPIFATQPSKNQDILAAALADTDVFQQDQHASQSKLQSQLSPNSTLYPMNVGNVLETSLTLSSPIMTPLEVPSTNSKKIPDDEADILTQVPKNVDLPITITDPNISQTVSHQQVASLIATELQTNLELSLPISEGHIAVSSTEMNSPGYSYSLPTLDDSVDIHQKPFNSSMPLLTEDVEESSVVANDKKLEKSPEPLQQNEDTVADSNDQNVEGQYTLGVQQSMATETRETNEKSSTIIPSDGSFMEDEEGLCTLGGEMCSSLSEPPPDMFDLQGVTSSFMKNDVHIPESVDNGSVTNSSQDDLETPQDHITESDSPKLSSEDSCEIPVQPQIVTDLSKPLRLNSESDLKRSLQLEDDEEDESKRIKFD